MSVKGKGSRSKADTQRLENERAVLRSHAEGTAEAPRKTAIVEPTLRHAEDTAAAPRKTATVEPTLRHAEDTAAAPRKTAIIEPTLRHAEDTAAAPRKTATVEPTLRPAEDTAAEDTAAEDTAAEDTAAVPRATAIVESTELQCETEPPYKLGFKVWMSSFFRYKCQVANIDTNPDVRRALDDIYGRMFMHTTYAQWLYIIQRRCVSFLEAVQKASNAPVTRLNNSINLQCLPDEDFDVWLTVEMDARLKIETRVESSPKCSQNMKQVLTERTVEFDMDTVWAPIHRLLCYVRTVAMSFSEQQKARGV